MPISFLSAGYFLVIRDNKVKKYTVVVIDDDATVRTALENTLGKDIYTVISCDDGPSGIKAAKKKKPDLILLDWMMPGMDGLDVLCELKKTGKISQIPVFMLTGKGDIGDIEKAFNLGADDYITKPFTCSKIVEIVTTKLEKILVPAQG